MEGVLSVYARDPQTFYLTVRGKIKEPLKDVVLRVSKTDNGFVFQCTNRSAATSWQHDTEMLEELETVRVLGQSAKALLLD